MNQLKAFVPILILTVVIFISWASGLVVFTYEHVVPNEPLQHPHKVQMFNGTNMLLDNGAVIAFWCRPPLDGTNEEDYVCIISNIVRRSDFQIDIETNKTGSLDISVRWLRKFRDTVPPFEIPLIRQTVGKYQRFKVAFGAYVQTTNTPNGAKETQQDRSARN